MDVSQTHKDKLPQTAGYDSNFQFLQAPNHSSVHTPQNAAWLSAINNAQRSILIQTPNMNAEPLLEPILDAVRRGVVVSCYLCLGYNDAGELLPFQNGTNEMISNRLYKSLETDEEKSRLRICYYVGKDQTRPIHNSFKKRSCHIKLMIVDEQIAIQGKSQIPLRQFNLFNHLSRQWKPRHPVILPQPGSQRAY